MNYQSLLLNNSKYVVLLVFWFNNRFGISWSEHAKEKKAQLQLGEVLISSKEKLERNKAQTQISHITAL
jgi:hypothetical protein